MLLAVGFFFMQQVATTDLAPPVERLLPAALDWYEEVVRAQWPRGRTLNKVETVLAEMMEVKYPERVRVVTLERFPLPGDDALRAEAERYGLGGCRVIAFTVGYVVMVKPGYETDRRVLAHEFVHVAQQERQGVEQSVRRLLTEYRAFGPLEAPLEREARERARALE